MVLGGVLMVLLPLIIIGVATFLNSLRVLEGVSKVRLSQTAHDLAATMHASLQREWSIVGAIAEDPEVVRAASTGEFRAIDEKMADIFRKVGADYEGLAVFDRNGIVSADGAGRRRIGLCIAERKYFQSTMIGTRGTGPLLISKATGVPVFALSAPIMSRDGRPVGGVLGVIKSEFLLKQLNAVRVGKTGHAFMINEQGLFMAYPGNENLLADMTKTPGLEKIALRMLSQETGTEDYVHEGTRKVAGFAPVELMGWSIGVTQDRKEIMALAYQNRNLELVVACGFLIITVLAVLFFSRRISNPVQKTLATLNQAIQQSAEAVWIAGRDRVVQFVNPATEAIVDRPAHDLVGNHPCLENRDGTSSEEIWTALDAGTIWSGCITGKRRDGASYFMDVSITPVRDEKGSITCFLAVGKDITRELLMEEQLRQLQKMEAVGTLAGGIAHDFNNILTTIIGYGNLLQMKMGNADSASPYVDSILSAAQKAADLTQGLLAFSRQQPVTLAPLDINDTIRETEKLLKRLLNEDIEMRTSFVTTHTVVLGDKTQIDQILFNLVTNARDAMPDGGILTIGTDIVEMDDEFIRVHGFGEPGRYVRITVSDTGVGMDKATRQNIFDPFFTTKEVGKGTGLGLATVYGIVKHHGGHITVDARLNEGTSFDIYLPSVETTVDGVEQKTVSIETGTETILVAEDNAEVRRFMEDVLQHHGYTTIAAADGDDAIRKFRESRAVDLIILDSVMPKKNGREVYQEIQRLHPDVRAIFTSGYTRDIVLDKGIEEREWEFIPKPLSPAMLLQKVREVLDR
jgi:PAS domain S-box-containing protein